MSENTGFRVVVVSGSPRPSNFTRKAVGLVLDELQDSDQVRVDLIDLAGMDLTQPGRGEVEQAKKLQEMVHTATGVILATPEYHGSFSSAIKLFIENLGFPSTLSGKPVALLGVAAGQIGAIKSLEHLRSVCSHVGAIVLPGPISVAGVQQLFDDRGNCLDEGTEKHIRGVARNLLDYIHRNLCPHVALEEMIRKGGHEWMRHYKDS